MEVLDGDIERTGWELRTTGISPEEIGSFLLPRAVRLMEDTSSLSQEIRFHNGRWPRSAGLEVTDSQNIDMLRTGWYVGSRIDEDMMRHMLALARMPKLKFPRRLVASFNEFAEVANDIFGPLSPEDVQPDHQPVWCSVRNLPVPDPVQAWFENNPKGHCDKISQGNDVSSIQLSPTPSLWILEYFDKEDGAFKKTLVEQKLGEEILLRSAKHQTPLLPNTVEYRNTSSVTPYHFVINKDSKRSRYSFLRYHAKITPMEQPKPTKWYNSLHTWLKRKGN